MTEPQITPTPDETTQLGRGLQVRHLTMMGLGSVIDAGPFLGTGVDIRAAGPGVLIPYVITGFIVVLVMQMLGEMVAARPTSGNFPACIEMVFGSLADFVLSWLCWFMLVMVLGVEITGTGAIMGTWFGIPGWTPGLVYVVFFVVVSLANAHGFGESKFWFTFIRVTVTIAFLVIDVLLFLGLLPGTSFVGTTHTAESGFLLSSVPSIVADLLAVASAFGGIEIATITTTETEDPRRSIVAAVRSAIFHVFMLYLGYVIITTLLLPYSQIGGADSTAESPSIRVLRQANIPDVVNFMEAIIVLVLLSVFSAQIYVASRLIYSMSTRGRVPRFFVHTNKDAVPNRAVIMSMIFAFVSMDLQVVFDSPSVLIFLLNAVGGCLLIIWLITALFEIKLRLQMEANNKLPVRMQVYPTLFWVAVILIMGPAIDMFIDPGVRQQVIAVVCVTAFLAVPTALTRKSRAVTHEVLESSDSN